LNGVVLDSLAATLFDALFVTLALYGARRAGVVAGLTSRGAMTILGFGLCLQLVLAGAYGARLPLAFIVLLSAGTVAAATDAAGGYVFDAVTLPALAVLLSIAAFAHQLPGAAVGAGIAGGAMFALYAVTLGRGLGLGDVKLACCAGAGLGAYSGLISLGVAFVLGGLYAAFLLITRRGSRGDEIRFAPYMAAGIGALALCRMLL
jgi:prepilin signal peptidase PulO-like enzyme (type II secretory pathway)